MNDDDRLRSDDVQSTSADDDELQLAAEPEKPRKPAKLDEGISNELVTFEGEEDDAESRQFGISTVMALTVATAILFLLESLAAWTPQARILTVPIGVGVAVALFYLTTRQYRLLVTLLMTAYFASLFGRVIGFDLVHLAVFVYSTLLTAYFFSSWLDDDVQFDLLSPPLAILLLALLALLIWWTYFPVRIDDDFFPFITTCFVALPFAVGTVIRLLGLH
ncbi:MAG: hypothetical protein DWQ31_20100 [Planctomycetota bacterium]|nr:MAG: hypothetical protein DWQ31_20100 [Planctomycetota bacterium]REJ97780.1 MAG: hypothetical protein DWQ35_01340 [Planctomycetota bacterium]REK17839.1 MAG: hypothetical protein DWQ42_21230 [Planctomycetota bacterium]REK49231.1 MAG: hypothetical protein DWQ46_00755 [Planctomycetota bacterium]